MNPALFLANFKLGSLGGIGIPLFILIMLGMILLPLPVIALDILFTFNISLSIVVILVCVYTRKPLDFAIFPTVILLATLLRLALNIASTRVILLHGHNGGAAAGQVIESFGHFVAGGNFAVGLIVFIILIIINFVVVTKGAGRISEVSARFTLDAMPGKQMAIDADLNAGIITQDEAKARRAEVIGESDFYGAMDGASKFVRGDAVAGILVLVINVVGGLAIGMSQHDLGFAEALKNYTLLTIGDGLAGQIPALILSTAAAIMVTRASATQDVGGQIISQLFSSPRVFAITGVILGIMGAIPGMPNVAFLTLAAVCGAAAYTMMRREHLPETQAPITEHVQELTVEPKDVSWDDVTPVDVIGLEVGYRLIPMVDKAQGGQLMGRIKGVRKKLTQELGFLVPPVHIRDNLDLSPNGYRVTLMGVVVGEGQVHPEREMAINPGQVYGTPHGIADKEPAFGLAAVWIEPGVREEAQTMGYTVVDASTVVATHISHIVQTQAYQLIGREEVRQILDNLARSAPKLVEDLNATLSHGVVLKVMQNLLEDGIPVRDMRTIAESLAGQSGKSQDPAVLTEFVRNALGRMIVQQINGMVRELPVITLDPGLEHLLLEAMQAQNGSGLNLEPGLAERTLNSLAQAASRQEAGGQPAVLLVPVSLRGPLAKLVRHSIPTLQVLSYTEIPDDKQIRIVASIGR